MDETELRRRIEEARQTYEWLRLRLRLLTPDPAPGDEVHRRRRATADAGVPVDDG
jgi:hypothetical protein